MRNYFFFFTSVFGNRLGSDSFDGKKTLHSAPDYDRACSENCFISIFLIALDASMFDEQVGRMYCTVVGNFYVNYSLNKLLSPT